MHSFMQLFIQIFIHSFIQLFFHSSIQSFIHLLCEICHRLKLPVAKACGSVLPQVNMRARPELRGLPRKRVKRTSALLAVPWAVLAMG